MPDLKLRRPTVKGERTPCLEGHAEELFPALIAHNMTYDSSFTETGISWPKKSPQYEIWRLGHGRPSRSTAPASSRSPWITTSITRSATPTSEGVTPAQSDADSAQVQATYNDMYNATFNGNRAPLILGNHFNEWNNSAYENALTDFVLSKCGQPDT